MFNREWIESIEDIVPKSEPKPRLRVFLGHYAPGFPLLWGIYRTSTSSQPIAIGRSLTELAKHRIFKGR